MSRKMSGVENRYVSEVKIEATARRRWDWMPPEEREQMDTEYQSIVTYWDDMMTSPEEYVVEGFDTKSEALNDSHTRLATILPAIRAIMLAAK